MMTRWSKMTAMALLGAGMALFADVEMSVHDAGSMEQVRLPDNVQTEIQNILDTDDPADRRALVNGFKEKLAKMNRGERAAAIERLHSVNHARHASVRHEHIGDRNGIFHGERHDEMGNENMSHGEISMRHDDRIGMHATAQGHASDHTLSTMSTGHADSHTRHTASSGRAAPISVAHAGEPAAQTHMERAGRHRRDVGEGFNMVGVR